MTTPSHASRSPQQRGKGVPRAAHVQSHVNPDLVAGNLSRAQIQHAQRSPTDLRPAQIVRLQSTIGNDAVRRMLARPMRPTAASGAHAPVVQPKLQVGPVGDRYEQEAERVAGQVMRSLQQPLPTRSDDAAQPPAKSFAGSNSTQVQRRAQPDARKVAKDGSFETDTKLEHEVKGLHGGKPLPNALRRQFEPRFGADFSAVRVHTGPQAVQLNRDMQAKAFTYGQNIAFNTNQYSPGTTAGKQLLAHELTHVVQQKGDMVRRKEGMATARDAESRIAPTLRTSPTVQRRFGFEIETPILLTQNRIPEGKTEEEIAEVVSPRHPVVAEETDYAVHVDHNARLGDLEVGTPKGPIVELVTKPMDEFALSEKEVGAKMQKLVDFVKRARNKTKQFTKRRKLRDVGEVTPTAHRVYIGSNNPNAPARQGTRGEVQVTYGLRLERIGEAFRMHANANPTESVTRNLVEAANNGDAVTNMILNRYQNAKTYVNEEGKHKTRKLKNSFTIQQAEIHQLHGLMTLMSNYLIAGRGDSVLGVGWDKNKLGMFFYKSQLSSVRAELTGAADTVLKARAAKIGNMLLAQNNRRPNENILPSVGVTAQDWVTRILSGKSDPVFMSLKNSYGKEIEPEPIGEVGSKSTAAVLENRKLGLLRKKAQLTLAEQLKAKKGNLGGGTPPDKWVPLAKKIYQALRIVNGAGDPDHTAWNALMS